MSKEDGFNEARAELFEALGHPIRVKILEALESKPMGFAEIKKVVGIESSGHLQFHLRKLNHFIKDGEDGNYVLTDDGNEALRVFRTTAESITHGKDKKTRPGKRVSGKVVAAACLIAVLVLLSAFAASGGIVYAFQHQLNTYSDSSYVPGSWYTIHFNETGGRWVDFNIVIGGLPAGNQSQVTLPVHIQIAHAQGIDLQSLKLEFTRASIGCCWVFDSADFGGVGGYPPPSSRFFVTSAGGTELDVQNFGFVGTGSVNIFLDLVLDRASSQVLAPNGNGSIEFVIVMQLQDSNYLLFPNQYYGNAYMSMTPQPNGLLTINRAP